MKLLEFDQIREQIASYTRTVQGRERAGSLAPSRDLLEIATRQQETTEAREFLDGGGSLEFGPSIDFREYLRRALLGGLLRGQELLAVHDLAAAARYDRNQLLRHEELPLISGVAENIPNLGALEREIGNAISPSGDLLDSASPGLRQFRQDTRSAIQRLNEVMERNLRRLQRQDVVQEPLITERNGRSVLLIKSEMRYRVPGIVHDVSDSGATVFVEPMSAIDVGNRWREARSAEEREEERILRHLSNLVGDAGQDLLLTLDLIGRLDLDMAKGRYSANQKASAPWVTDQDTSSRRLILSGARHPLLGGPVVPINVELGGDQPVLLITGPNAGGKTVALKTVGLLAMMAQSGLHVPADEAHFPRLDGVYADIGDRQSIQRSLSTFSSHIQNLLTIMGRATAHSLVLVDELGTSTDPEEGAALAKAILNHFQRMGVLIVATTHHRGVAHHVQEQPGMVNASVDLHPDTLEPTFRLTLGLPGRSYALTIAARLGVPPEIIEEARNSLSPVEQAAENLLQELQQERRLVEELRQEAEAARVDSVGKQRDVEAQLASVETSKVELVEQARQELHDRISGILSQLQHAERLLELAEARPESTRSVQSQIRQQREELTQVRQEVTAPQWQPIELRRVAWQESLKGGDRVYIRGIPRPVEVISPPDEANQVEVLLGTMRAKVPVYQLERPAESHRAAAQAGVYFSRAAKRKSLEGLDLRGLRVDEALSRVETSLNDAALDGVREIQIIHGKGTGALRKAIREYLEGHPLVQSAASGEGPGGDGVTVAELR